ncbi:DUF6153 family protein [Streptomyces sp. NPDC056937]|uniref:DUF6153 family protein n=1 Tax=Streptomyces sp. NPDC056937 TaxID=3345969 RepID=UPI003627A0A8
MKRWSPRGRTRSSGPRVPLLLLVTAVMTGLLAMHGLSPVPTTEAHAASAMGPRSASVPASSVSASSVPASSVPASSEPASSVPAPSSHAMAAGTVDGDCAHQRHGGGGHLDHADATCAAAGVGAGPALPTSLASALPSGPLDVPAALRQAPGTATGDRAPPSLSELQLLRI